IITVVTTLLSFLNIFFSYTTLFRSGRMRSVRAALLSWRLLDQMRRVLRSVSGTAGAPVWKTLSTCRRGLSPKPVAGDLRGRAHRDRKSTRLNSSHVKISYAVFFLKK